MNRTNYFKLLALSCIIFSTNSVVHAQQDLPIYMTSDEIMQMPSYHFPTEEDRSIITSPPTGSVRAAAGWEEIQSLVVCWTSYQTLLRDIVRNARLECEVIIICTDSVQVKNYLTAGNVPLSNVKYLVQPYNSVWMRDYGGNTVYMNDVDSLIYVDWIYNRPRPKDDPFLKGWHVSKASIYTQPNKHPMI